MTTINILAMAREAGLLPLLDEDCFQSMGKKNFEATKRVLKRFAELVRADAIAEEREACAYKAGIALLGADRGLANRVDQAIRTRGQRSDEASIRSNK